MYKHRNCIIEKSGTESFPEMVTVTNAPKLRKQFIGKRYITLEKCFLQIELFESQRLINSKDKYVKSQLEDVVILDE
tara:strand:+ start:483 stop:713 length:231 start_codon:yes stop_codon:yes gene_type:complete